MAFVTLNKELKVYTWPQLDIVHSYKPKKLKNGHIHNVSYSKDGSMLLLVPENTSPEIFALKNSQLKQLHIVSSVENVTWATFSNTTKKNIAIATSDGDVLIYDIKYRKKVKTFSKCNSSIYKIEYAHTDNHLVSGCNNGELIVYGNQTNVISSTIKYNASKISTFCCINDKPHMICSAHENGSMKLWDIHRNKQMSSVEAHFDTISHIVSPYWLPNLVISISSSQNVCMYDTISNKLVGKLKEKYLTVDVCLKSQNLVCGNSDGCVVVYDLKNLSKHCTLRKVDDNAIKQIVFQKTLKEIVDNSLIEICVDELQSKTNNAVSSDSTSYLYDSNANSKGDIDSFVLPINRHESTSTANNTNEVKDSFLDSFMNSPAAFLKDITKSKLQQGLCANQTKDSFADFYKSSILRDLTNTSPFISGNGQITPKLSEKESVTTKKSLKTETSTPVAPVATKFELDAMVDSPITQSGSEVIATTTTSKSDKCIQTVTADTSNYITKTEFEQQMSKFKEELIWEMKHSIQAALNTVLIAHVEDAITMQELYSNLKTDLLKDTVKIYTNSDHIQEIEALKREIALLKKKANNAN